MRTCAVVLGAFARLSIASAQPRTVRDAPRVQSPFILTAAYDAAAAHKALFFNGRPIPPTIRVLPGHAIALHYVNNLPLHSTEQCALGSCADHSNLHFSWTARFDREAAGRCADHDGGSPRGTKLRRCNTVLSSTWGFTGTTRTRMVRARDKISTACQEAIVIDGIDRYYPELGGMRERVLILRDKDIKHESRDVRHHILQQVGVPPTVCERLPSSGPIESLL